MMKTQIDNTGTHQRVGHTTLDDRLNSHEEAEEAEEELNESLS